MAYCSAACDVLPSMSSQQLTMCLWGLAVSGASPHKAFVLLWFLTSIGLMQQATTQVSECADTSTHTGGAHFRTALPSLKAALGASSVVCLDTYHVGRRVFHACTCFGHTALLNMCVPATLPVCLQELSMWLYALTLLRLTPSPSWCAAFVEASFSPFTAPDTRPQVSQHTCITGSVLGAS
jgi:hypothetical protein